MTEKEFNNTSFHSKMTGTYKGKPYRIVGVNFEDCLIDIESIEYGGNSFWIMCEEFELKK